MNSPMTMMRSNLLGVASVLIGVLGLGVSFLPYVNGIAWLLAPIAIVMSIFSFQRPPRAFAIVGLVAGLAALGTSVTWQVMRRAEAARAEQKLAETASGLDSALVEMGKRPEGSSSSTAVTTVDPVVTRDDPGEGTTSAFAPPKPPQAPEKMTLGEYNTLTNGMSYEQVVYVAGSEGTLSRELNSGTITVRTYEWRGSGPNAVAQLQFQNNALTSKMQTGLE